MALGQVGSMAVALLGDIKDFDQKMNAASGRVDTFSSSVKKMGDSVTKYAKLAAAAAVAAVTAFGVSSVKYFIDIDTGMREVFTLMPELSAIAKEEMMEDVSELSEAIAVVPDEVIPALYQAISAGVPRENVFEFLEVAGRAAIGGVTELSIAVDGLTTVTNAYGSEIISVGEAADIMFTAVKFGKTTFDELSDRLFQAVPIAASVGLEFGNIAASAAQITLSGVPMRVAMTQIRSLLNEVAFEGKELNKVFQEAAGMSFQQYIDAGGDIAGIIEILEGAAKKAGVSIAELTANLEAQGALLNLSGVNLDSLRSILDEMANSAGAADAAYEEMANGIQYQINQLKVWWANLKLDIGGDLAESLQDLLGWLEDNQEAISAFVGDIFDSFINGLQWIADHSEAVKVGLIAISVGLTALVSINLTKWVLTLGGALSAMSPTVLAALVALAGLYGIFKGGEAILEGTAGSVEHIADEMEDLAAMLDPLRGGMISMTDAAGQLDNRMWLLSESFDSLTDAGRMTQEQADLIKAEIRELYEQVKDAPDLYAILESGNWDRAMNNILSKWGEDVPDLLRLIVDVPTAAERSAALMGQFTNQMAGAWYDLSTAIEGDASDAADGIDTASDDIKESFLSILPVAEKVQIGLGIGFTEIQERLIELNEELQASYEETWQAAEGVTKNALGNMLNEFAEFRWTRLAEEEAHEEALAAIREEYADASDRELATALWKEEQAYKESRTTIKDILVNALIDLLGKLRQELLLKAASHLVDAIALALIPGMQITAGGHLAAAGVYAAGGAGLALAGFETGGIVPGPLGEPMPAIVHGGEQVLTVEQQAAQAIDYEKLGQAVYAGTYDAISEMKDDTSPSRQSGDILTKLSQLLYPPLQKESQRRGGTIL